MAAAQALFYLLAPALALWAARRFRPAGALGPVVLCYAAGVLLGNSPLAVDPTVAMKVAQVAVPLAIPLLLFRTDLRGWLKLARGLLLAFVLACVAAVGSAVFVGAAFAARTDEWWKIAGMLVGVYVGGTANMSAVGLATGVREHTFVVLNAADTVMGGLYLLVLLTVAQRVLLRFLPRFVPSGTPRPVTGGDAPRATWRSRAGSLALAGVVVGLSAGGVHFFLGQLQPAAVMLALTTLALLLSLSPRVQALAGSEGVGEYVLLVFCAAIGSLADVRMLAGTSTTLFLYVALVMGGSIVLHVLLCRAFGLDADTVLIASTATIFGPAFIGPVAAAIKNRELVGPGITLGLAGLALGTYLGLATCWLLRALF